MTKIVNSWNDFDPLKRVIVGRADFSVIPPEEPATSEKVPIDSEMRGMWGPRPTATAEAAKDFVTTEVEPMWDAADVMRVGKDLFIQHGLTTNRKAMEWFKRYYPDLRVHAVNFPGDPYPIHIDATFVPLPRPTRFRRRCATPPSGCP